MQLACPKCGCNLSTFDTAETGACPKCGLQFTDNSQPVPVDPLSAESGLAKSFKPPGFLWLILLVGPGALAVGVALLARLSRDSIALGVWSGVALALATSYLLAFRYENWAKRLLMTALFFGIAFVVNGFVFFAGCMFVIGSALNR